MSDTGLTEPLTKKNVETLLMRCDVAGERIAVGVSGGADSMALTLLLSEWCQAHDKQLIALTVDHSLREESAKEAQIVAGWLRARDVEHHIIAFKKPILVDASLPARARDARYDTLWKWCAENNVKTLAVGHHADDQMETFMMRLISGSGIKGLLAMDPVSVKSDGRVLLRPFLTVKKATLIATLEKRNQAWIEDPTNQKEEFTRNRLRKKIIPLLIEEGLTPERMGAVIGKLSSTYEVLETSVNAWLSSYVKLYDAGYTAIPLEVWRDEYMPREIHKQALSTLLQTVSGKTHGYPPRDATLMPLLKQIPTLEKTTTAHGCLIIPDEASGELYIAREWQRVEALALSDNSTVWDGRFAFKASLDGQEELTIRPLGENGIAQLISEDIVLPTLPLQVLYSFPSLWRLENLVSVPHIEYGEAELLSDFEFTSKATSR